MGRSLIALWWQHECSFMFNFLALEFAVFYAIDFTKIAFVTLCKD